MTSRKQKAKPEKGKPAEQKRSKLPRRSDYSSDFKKAWKRYESAGRVDLTEVKTIMTLLINNDAPLPAEYKDHALVGGWDGYRECHVRNNHLLVYKLVDGGETVLFADMGTHAELFRGG